MAYYKSFMIGFISFAVTFHIQPTTANPSFDCTEAATNIERMICANQQLSEADNKLSIVYHQALQHSTDIESLRRQQIAWLKTVRNGCATVECLLAVYNEREHALDITSSINSPTSTALPATAEHTPHVVDVETTPDTPKITTATEPTCTDAKTGAHDFLPCDSCELDKKTKSAAADFFNNQGQYAIAAGVRNGSQLEGLTDNNDPNFRAIVEEALRDKVMPKNIMICRSKDESISVIQYKQLFAIHGIVTQDGEHELGHW